MKKPFLVALARNYAGLAHEVNLSGAQHSKKALIALLEPYFATQRAALPKQKRSNAWRRPSWIIQFNEELYSLVWANSGISKQCSQSEQLSVS